MVVYVLKITIAGPGFHHQFVVEDDELSGLDPTYRKHDGKMWERYGPDDGYYEVRSDQVVSRELIKTEQVAPDTDDSADPPVRGWMNVKSELLKER